MSVISALFLKPSATKPHARACTHVGACKNPATMSGRFCRSESKVLCFNARPNNFMWDDKVGDGIEFEATELPTCGRCAI